MDIGAFWTTAPSHSANLHLQPFCCGFFRLGNSISPLRLPVTSSRGWRQLELQVRQASAWGERSLHSVHVKCEVFRCIQQFLGCKWKHGDGLPPTSMNPCVYVMWNNAMQCNAMWCDVMKCYVMSCHAMWCYMWHVKSCSGTLCTFVCAYACM